MGLLIDYKKCKELGLQDDEAREIEAIIKIFLANVKGKKISNLKKIGHDGASGHYLEDLFGIKRSSASRADFGNFELKKSSPKTSLGDWSPDGGSYHIGKIKPKDGRIGKKQYLEDYGRKNVENNYHVTGPFYYGLPEIKTGLILQDDGKNIFLFDPKKNIKVIEWTEMLMRERISKKFKSGVAVVRLKGDDFDDLDFYLGFDFEKFLSLLRLGEIIYDPSTSMKRPYSHFRFRSAMGSLVKYNYTYFLFEIKK